MNIRGSGWLLGSIVASLLLAACSEDYVTRDATPVGYTQPGPTPNIVVLVVIGGAHDSVSAKLISQGSNEVVVSAEIKAYQGPQTAVALHLDASLTLDAPLNGRTIRDDSGAEIPAQSD